MMYWQFFGGVAGDIGGQGREGTWPPTTALPDTLTGASSPHGSILGGSLIITGVGTPMTAPSSMITLPASPIRLESSMMEADPLAVADTFLKSLA